MPLINWKLELKCKWTKYCVFSAAGADNFNDILNDNANVDNLVFTINIKNYGFLM